ncbi:glutamate-rich protein 6-like isoform X2 [Heterodontus francisci]|uniref:glutamate-rich protein 6-like isoform X2 n=1 Tax=Heterodontus francisci TaxID=7792 RepID=UPI00355C0017
MSEQNVGELEGNGTEEQQSSTQVDLDSSVSSDTPSMLKSFSWEESTSISRPDDRADETTPYLLDSPAESLGTCEPLLMSVLTQTDSSWLLSHSLKKEKLEIAEERESEFFSKLSAYFSSESSDKESCSILEDDVSDSTSKGSLDDLIVHTEFIDDMRSGKLFGSTLYTLPSVGPPTILAYKHESREKPIDYKAISPKVKSGWLRNLRECHDFKEYWQWTRNKLMQKEHPHLSTAKQLSWNQELVVKEQHLSKFTSQHKWKQFRQSVVSVGFDLCQFCGKSLKPLPTHKQLSIEAPETLFCCKQYQDLFEFLMTEEELMRSKAGLETIDISPHLAYSSVLEREQAKARVAMRLRDREMEKYLKWKKSKETQHKFFANQSSKKLSTIAFQLSTSLDFVTLKESKEIDEEWDNIFTESGDDTFSWHKDIPSSFLVKYYGNGNKFLTTFLDGTAQIFYPSGNLAILIFTDQQKKFTCIVQEDRADDPAIQAVFGSYGRCTCYHPNGVVWININALGGHYSDKQGTRMKRWYWRDRLSPLILIPFKPIFISLNENIGVRIIEQERIFISFLAMGKQAKFKVGTKLKASRLKVQTAINKLCIALNFPNNDPEKIPLPLYLVSQQQRLAQLYANIKMDESTEVEKVP